MPPRTSEPGPFRCPTCGCSEQFQNTLLARGKVRTTCRCCSGRRADRLLAQLFVAILGDLNFQPTAEDWIEELAQEKRQGSRRKTKSTSAELKSRKFPL